MSSFGHSHVDAYAQIFRLYRRVKNAYLERNNLSNETVVQIMQDVESRLPEVQEVHDEMQKLSFQYLLKANWELIDPPTEISSGVSSPSTSSSDATPTGTSPTQAQSTAEKCREGALKFMELAAVRGDSIWHIACELLKCCQELNWGNDKNLEISLSYMALDVRTRARLLQPSTDLEYRYDEGALNQLARNLERHGDTFMETTSNLGMEVTRFLTKQVSMRPYFTFKQDEQFVEAMEKYLRTKELSQGYATWCSITGMDWPKGTVKRVKVVNTGCDVKSVQIMLGHSGPDETRDLLTSARKGLWMHKELAYAHELGAFELLPDSRDLSQLIFRLLPDEKAKQWLESPIAKGSSIKWWQLDGKFLNFRPEVCHVRPDMQLLYFRYVTTMMANMKLHKRLASDAGEDDWVGLLSRRNKLWPAPGIYLEWNTLALLVHSYGTITGEEQDRLIPLAPGQQQPQTESNEKVAASYFILMQEIRNRDQRKVLEAYNENKDMELSRKTVKRAAAARANATRAAEAATGRVTRSAVAASLKRKRDDNSDDDIVPEKSDKNKVSKKTRTSKNGLLITIHGYKKAKMA